MWDSWGFRKNPLAINTKSNWRIEIKFNFFQVIIISSSFVMVCYIMMGFYTWWLCLTPNCVGQTWDFKYILNSQDHGVSTSRLQEAIVLEVSEGVCWIMWCLCLSQESLSSFSWIPLMTTNLYVVMIFNLHKLHHVSFTF